MIKVIFFILLGAQFFSFFAQANVLNNGASATMSEESFIVSNGQGVSSPSFWNALDGQNPAGLVFNQSLKMQVGAASYGRKFLGGGIAGYSDSLSYGTAGLIFGNGLMAAGAEYTSYPNYFGAGNTEGLIHWGLAGRLQTLYTTIGFSSHNFMDGGLPKYDFGVIIEPFSDIRLGFLMPNFTAPEARDSFAAGITYLFNSMFDLVADIDFNTTSASSTLKPGITVHTENMQFTTSYGLRYKGEGEAVLYQHLSAGFGMRLTQTFLFSYEYRGITTHRLGLTIRFN